MNLMHEENYKGLHIFALYNQGSPAVDIILKGFGIPGKELTWMRTLNLLGHTAVHASYRGTWLSQGEFLSDAENPSVLADTLDMIAYVDERYKQPKINLIADCFGASPALVAAAMTPRVEKILIYGGMIYSSDRDANQRYRQAGDKAFEIGDFVRRVMQKDQTLDQSRVFYDGYTGFDFKVYLAMINGRTRVNPYDCLPSLARKEILLMHPQNDGLISSQRSQDFYNALEIICRVKGVPDKARLHLIQDRGHGSGFGDRELSMALKFLCGAEGFSPRVLYRKSGFFMRTLFSVIPAIKRTKKGYQRSDGKWFGVPFASDVEKYLARLKDEGKLRDDPVEVLMNEIFKG